MSAKAIREFDGKHLLAYWLPKSHETLAPTGNAISSAFLPPTQLASVSFDTKLLSSSNELVFKAHVSSALSDLEKLHPWLKTTRLVCKPDQLIKRRGKAGLLGINLEWEAVKEWISSRAGTTIKVRQVDYGKGFLLKRVEIYRLSALRVSCTHSSLNPFALIPKRQSTMSASTLSEMETTFSLLMRVELMLVTLMQRPKRCACQSWEGCQRLSKSPRAYWEVL